MIQKLCIKRILLMCALAINVVDFGVLKDWTVQTLNPLIMLLDVV